MIQYFVALSSRMPDVRIALIPWHPWPCGEYAGTGRSGGLELQTQCGSVHGWAFWSLATGQRMSEVSNYLTTMPKGVQPLVSSSADAEDAKCQHIFQGFPIGRIFILQGLLHPREGVFQEARCGNSGPKCQIIRRNSCKTRQGWDNWETSRRLRHRWRRPA